MTAGLWTALRLLTSRRPGPLTSAAGASWGRGGSLRATFTTRGGRSWRRADTSKAPWTPACSRANWRGSSRRASATFIANATGCCSRRRGSNAMGGASGQSRPGVRSSCISPATTPAVATERRGTICFPSRRERVSSDTVKPMRMPVFAQRPGPRIGRGRDPTDPGGPSPEVLAAALAACSSRNAPRADATVLSGGERRPATARLLVTAGPHKGAEFRIAEPLTTLGRAATNAIVIPDISISREHLAVEKKGDAFVLVDRESGNGTRVNGRWRRRRPLRHGDEIEIGDSTLCFLAPGGVIACAPMRVHPRGRQGCSTAAPRVSVLAALSLAIVLVVAAAFVRRQRMTGQFEAQAHREAARAVALRKLEEGIALVKQGRFAEGRGRLAVAAELEGADAEIARAIQAAIAEEERAAAAESRVAPRPPAATPAEGTHAPPGAHPIWRTSPRRRRARDAAADLARAGTVSAEQEGRRALAARHLLAAGSCARTKICPAPPLTCGRRSKPTPRTTRRV